jgi:hypothetical protein
MLLKVLTIVVLIGIIYEDFKYRLVKVVSYLLLLVFLVVLRVNELPFSDLLISAGINVLYLLLMLSICVGYIYVKFRSFKLVNQFFGLGDVLFLIAISMWFDPVVFVFFNTASFMVALILHFIFRNIPSYNNKSVPLAGMQSLCFIPVFIYSAYY